MRRSFDFIKYRDRTTIAHSNQIFVCQIIYKAMSIKSNLIGLIR